MGRVLFLVLAGALVALGFASNVGRAPSPIPMTTQGSAYDRSGVPLSVGTIVRTMIDGVDYSNDSRVQDAAGGFSVLTLGNFVINQTTPEPSPTKRGANLGESILYAAGSFATGLGYFQEVTPWYPGLTVTQNLHLGSAQTTAEPLRIQGIVTQPARGGAQYIYVCNPTASDISLYDYYLQVDRPGTYYGGNMTLAGTVPGGGETRVNLTSTFPLVVTGDALKIVYRNPGGSGASAGGRDIVIDRVEFNATIGGTLDWQPGSTILGSAPAPGPGQILERSPYCTPGRGPSAFQIATEPGLPTNLPPTVAITSPTPGQNVQGGQTFTFVWTMSDDIFATAYLRVWVNLTVQGTTTSLLSGSAGATSVDWVVPDVNAPNAVVRVEVIDPFGSTTNVTQTFNILPSTPYSAYIAILVVAVIAVFIVVAFYYARRQEKPPPAMPPKAEPPPQPAPPAGAAQPPATPPGAGMKTCPKCGTSIREEDASCFYCGHLFVKTP